MINNKNFMDIVSVFQKFKTQKQAIKHLEKVRWNKKPVCPYCGCVGATKVKELYKNQPPQYETPFASGFGLTGK